MAFEYLQGWRLHNLPGQPVPVLSHPHSKKVFPDVQTEPPVFQFVPFASWVVSVCAQYVLGCVVLSVVIREGKATL